MTETSTRPEECVGGEPPRRLSLSQGWQASIFTAWNFPARILESWDRLAAGYGDEGIMLESGWFKQWWLARVGHDRLFVVVLEYRDEVAAIFPCYVSGEGRLDVLADDFPYDFLIAPGLGEAALNRFLDTLRKAGGPSAAHLHNFTNASPWRAQLEKRLKSRYFPAGMYSRPSAPYVELRGASWEEYVDSLHSKLRNNLRKGRRRAAQDGELSFEIIQQPASLEEILREVFEVESRGWKGEQGTAMKCVPEKEAFYRGIAQWAMTSGRLYIFALRLNGSMIAFDYCILGGRTMFALRTGYDQNVAARFSPGNLMRYQVIEYVFRAGLDRYDFLGPAYPWKLEWTPHINTTTSFEIYPSNLPGWYGYFRKYGWKKPFKRSQRLIEFGRRLRAARHHSTA